MLIENKKSELTFKQQLERYRNVIGISPPQGIAPTMVRLGKLVRAWWQRNVSFPLHGYFTLCVIRQQSLVWGKSFS
jgi:hypothetical protein